MATTPVFLPGESSGQRSLVGCCPQRCTESDITEATQHACMHWRRKWQPTPIFLPGESHGQRRLVGCRLWGRTELETTEVTQQQQQQRQRDRQHQGLFRSANDVNTGKTNSSDDRNEPKNFLTDTNNRSKLTKLNLLFYNWIQKKPIGL